MLKIGDKVFVQHPCITDRTLIPYVGTIVDRVGGMLFLDLDLESSLTSNLVGEKIGLYAMDETRFPVLAEWATLHAP